ncbi:hypothetical protein L7F22_044020 [Adiantum nelumboides]|nr:hypothetical protein [Adiantum nelumboides]
MAARKLAAEIDKTLKKIGEGVQEFESIYDKLQNASTPSQSAKYESELKTSIKRLQRLRDNLKNWLQSNEIKDKSALMENRKLIEQQMEKFKASEKELKTKAFSKEGLAASRLDPAEKAKLELSQWLSNQVDELARQVETTEAEIEQLAGGTKKKKSGGASERLTQLEHLNDRRKWHSSRLEILLRMLENGALETERVEDIKEDISYFVESNGDEDFEEDDGIYDEFNLDEEEEAFGLKDTDDLISHDTVSVTDETPPPPAKPALKETPVRPGRRESEDMKVPEEKPRKASGTSTVAARKGSGSIDATPAIKDSKAIPQANFAQAKPPGIPTTSSAPPTASSPAKAPSTTTLPPIRYAAAAAAAVSPTTQTASPISGPPGISSRQASDAAGDVSVNAAAEAASNSNGHAVTQSPATSHAQSQSISSTPALENASVAQNQTGDSSSLGGQPHSPSSTNVSAGPPGLKPNGVAPSPPGLQTSSSAAPGQEVQSAIKSPSNFQPAQLAASSAAAGLVQPAGGGAGTSVQQAAAQRQQGTDARLPSSLADLVSSFESAKQNSMIRDGDLGQVHKSLESSLMNVPEPQDSDKPKYYAPQNPYPAPQWYPQSPATIFDNPAIYDKFDEDTLFYIFYYSQRDYHRYLAARELKRQSWRFSTRYGTWFRRHSEPIAINEEYEEGSYVYFDFESSWCQRRKNHFRFEYKYLESELV